jgi:hypothetical protein
MFTVKIPQVKNVSILKRLIKKENPSSLGNIDAKNIELWQVSFPVDDLEKELGNINLAGYLKLSPPSKKLTTFFTDVAHDYLHVIVKAPGTL